jgi:hypothetical protein
MAGPSLSDTLRRLGERTANGVRKSRVIHLFAGGAVVQDGRTGAIASVTTDEPIHAGDAVWTQPTKKSGGVVVHGRV